MAKMSTSSNSPSKAGSDTTTSSNSPTISTIYSTPSIDEASESLPWILHHIIEAKIPYELPLRIMFSFNAGQKLPTLKNVHKWWHYESQGKLITQFLSSLDKITPSIDDTSLAHLRNPPSGPSEERIDPDRCPYDRFMDHGNESLLELDFFKLSDETRQSQKGLPASFILSTCKRIFQKEYESVEFGQALTALDYLRDLEITRRDTLRSAAARLKITRDTWKVVLAENADALKWVELVQKYELMIEEGYAAIFVDIRIWTMVAEIKSSPFYKPNVLAMLNTLFPPSIKELPNDRIRPKVLHQYRSTFYRYITAVEVNGAGVLESLIAKLQKDDNRHSWRSTWDNLQQYIDLAELMIKQAEAVIGPGIELFLGEYTYDSPLARLDRQEPSRKRSSNSERSTSIVTFDTSFEGPTSRPRTLRSHGSSFGSGKSEPSSHGSSFSSDKYEPRSHGSIFDSAKFQPHCRSRTNTQSDVSNSFERPSISQSAKQSQDAGSLVAGNRSTPPRSVSPSLPKLDVDSIRSRQRAVSKPVLPFVTQDSPAAQHEAFSSPLIFPDPRKALQEKRRNIESRRSFTSNGEGTPRTEDPSSGRPSTSNDQPKPPVLNVKRLRTVSFHVAHMDNPPVPPPLPLRRSKKLPSDGGAFLNRPYEEPSPIDRSIRKKPSFSWMFVRKNSQPNDVGEEEVFNQTNALGILTTPVTNMPRPTLKTSKSMDSVQRTANVAPAASVLKTQRSFGESLRAKFNMKAAEESSNVLPIDMPVDDADIKANLKEAKTSKPSMALNLPHFEEFPKYVPGTVPDLWRPISSKQDSFDLRSKGGKYGQGEGTTPVFERPANSLYPDLKRQVGIEEKKPRSKARSKFEALLVKQGKKLPRRDIAESELKEAGKPEKKVPMEPLIITTTEQRLGSILSEFTKAIETGGEYERFIIVEEGFGEEDEHTPSDLGDAMDSPSLSGRLRPTKSTGDLKSDWGLAKAPKKKPAKVLKKIMKRNVTGTLINPEDISSPIPQNMPEWEEDLIATISKEYTRQWLMEEARARKYDLIKPEGRPINKEMPKRRLQQRRSSVSDVPLQPKRVRILKEPTVRRAFEEPRATPKPPQLPYRARKDSIFAPREPPPPCSPPAAKSRELDISKYSKF